MVCFSKSIFINFCSSTICVNINICIITLFIFVRASKSTIRKLSIAIHFKMIKRYFVIENKFSIIALIISFVALMAVFIALQSFLTLAVPPSFFAWMLCGLLWGLGFIVPGLSSSTFIVFFGLYGQMSEGISKFDFSVIIPLGIALLATFLLLSKVMKLVIDKFHSVVSHCVLGFVLATTLMISTASENGSPTILETFSGANIPIYIVCIVAGAAASFLLTLLFAKIRATVEAAEENSKEDTEEN